MPTTVEKTKLTSALQIEEIIFRAANLLFFFFIVVAKHLYFEKVQLFLGPLFMSSCSCLMIATRGRLSVWLVAYFMPGKKLWDYRHVGIGRMWAGLKNPRKSSLWLMRCDKAVRQQHEQSYHLTV